MTYSMELDLSNVSQTFGKVDYSTGYHSVEIKSSKERIFQVLHEMTPADVRLMRPLFIIRALPALLIGKNPFPKEKLPILKGMEKQGFRVIADQSDKLVFGVIGKFWKLSGPETDIPKKMEAYASDPPLGMAKAIGYFCCEPGDTNGSQRLIHATWVYTPDPRVKRKFGKYWTCIYPGAYLLRKSWLAAIKRKAERPI